MLHARLALLDELLDGLRSGRAGVFVIDGEAGIGESALLDYGWGPGGWDAVSAYESESELPLAGLRQLLRAVLGRALQLVQVVGRRSEPRSDRATASVSPPHSRPTASTAMRGVLPMLSP